MKTALKVNQVSKRFSGLQALSRVSLCIGEGDILGLIGPNGSGKTTLINTISGVLSPEEGQVLIGEKDITGWKTDQIARLGLARTFQTARLFSSLKVIENLEFGLMAAAQPSIDDQAAELLERFGLSRWAGETAGTLAYGLQRHLEIARAVATKPKFLLLDEPAAGLNEEESEILLQIIRDLRKESSLGCGILIVEHDLGLIMRLCDRIHVLNEGLSIAEGVPDEVKKNPQVIEAYLGKRYAASKSADLTES